MIGRSNGNAAGMSVKLGQLVLRLPGAWPANAQKNATERDAW
jgi:hypothetical protein